MVGLQTATDLGVVVFDVLRNDFHKPIVDGKCNRDNIEEMVTIGIMSGQLEPMDETDVKFVCDLIDDLINEYN